MLVVIILPFATSARYVQDFNTTVTIHVRKPNYTVRFHSNRNDGNPEETASQSFVYGTSQTLNANTFTNSPSDFLEWNTRADGSGESYDDEEEVNNLTSGDGAFVDLYAQWGTLSGGVAAIGNTIYTTLQAALDAVPKDNTQTTVRLLANTSETLKVLPNQNVILNLQGHTNSISDKMIMTNSGEVLIQNGYLISSSVSDGAINNNRSAKLTLQNVTLSLTADKGKQAIYNFGEVIITGNSYVSSESDPATAGNKIRATVQNLTGGRVTILSGTIVSDHFVAVTNSGDLTIGTEDGNPNANSLCIMGGTYGVRSTTNYAFYDGTIMGRTNGIDNDSFITDYESGYEILLGYEVIDGKSYEKRYLGIAEQLERVDFDPNEGSVGEPIRLVRSGEEIGSLPIPTRLGYDFDGWFTELTGGQQITEHTVITGPVTFYAHWTMASVARIGSDYYSSLQGAISAVPKTNVQTTVVLLKNTDEVITTTARQNIILDLQNYTLTNTSSGAVIENYCTLEIISGTITSHLDTGAINNNANAVLTISGGQVLATGSRQAIYNNNKGTVYITGDAYLSARTNGTPVGSTMGRATVQNLNGGTMVITGGTIVGLVQQAVSNEGTLTIGTKSDGNLSITSPEMRGETYGVVSTKGIKFYDGIAMGRTGGISGTVSDQEPDTTLTQGTQVVSGDTYYTAYLVSNLQQNSLNMPDMQMMSLQPEDIPLNTELTPEEDGIESGDTLSSGETNLEENIPSEESSISETSGEALPSGESTSMGENTPSGDTLPNSSSGDTHSETANEPLVEPTESSENKEDTNSSSGDTESVNDSPTENTESSSLGEDDEPNIGSNENEPSLTEENTTSIGQEEDGNSSQGEESNALEENPISEETNQTEENVQNEDSQEDTQTEQIPKTTN